MQKDFRSLVFSDEEAEGLVRTFQVIFLALFELTIKEHMEIANMKSLVNTLDGLGKAHLSGISKGVWDAEQRFERIQAIKGIIKPHFKERVGENVATENWTLELDNIMRLSTIENGQYDFKNGFHTFDDGSLNTNLIRKCIKTLVAEVNKGPHTNGYVIVGVTEGHDSLKQFQTHYGSIKGRKFENTHFYITGIDDEVRKYYGGNTDSYIKEVINIIKREPVDEETRQYILTHIKLPIYQDCSILVLHLKSKSLPVAYDDDYYVRNGNNNDKVVGISGITALQKRFEEGNS